MKYTTLLIAFLLALHARAQEYPCVQGISTNPAGPVNPDNTPPFLTHFLNTFNWMANSGGTLTDYALNDVFTAAGVSAMVHPYSAANSYDYLTSSPINDLDMYWQDGWELLSVNLGKYPDGTLLSSLGETSNYPDIPYLLLYNKQRGIIRLFASSLTGLNNNAYDAVRVTLKFNAPSSFSSGLLRHNGAYDVALDQQTPTYVVSTIVDHPNGVAEASQWFHADFQVGHDPCTCFKRSDLALQFKFLPATSFQNYSINSTGVYQNQNILDANNFYVENDFLTIADYSDNQWAGQGILVYSSPINMIDDYITRLEYQLDQAALSPLNSTAQLARNLAITRVYKHVVLQGGSMTITGDLATGLLQNGATDIVAVFVNGNTYTINQEALLNRMSRVMGKGFTWLSEQSNIDESFLSNESIPTASINDLTFDGVVPVESTLVSAGDFFNPGSYPNAEGMSGLSVNVHYKYPVYNEVLGLFAVLNTPKFVRYEEPPSVTFGTPTFQLGDNNTTACTMPVVGNGNFNELNSITHNITSHSTSQIKLAEPLNYVFNPAAGIDMANATVEASLVVKGQKTVTSPETETNNVLLGNSGFDNVSASFVFNENSSNLTRDVELVNLVQDEGPITAEGDGTDQVVFSTPFLPINEFNALVAGIATNTTHQRTEVPLLNPTSSCSGMFTNLAIFDFNGPHMPSSSAVQNSILNMLKIEGLSYELKLLVTMPFTQLGHNGEKHVTTQVFTFPISEDDITNVTSELPVLFSLDANPNATQGTCPISQNVSFGTHNWTQNDFNCKGGYYAGPNSTLPVIKPSAWQSILLSGNQTLNAGMHGCEFTADQEIIVSGDATIPAGFTLMLNDFFGNVAISNPSATSEYIGAFCTGNVPNPYLANQARGQLVGDELVYDGDGYTQAKKNLDAVASLQAYPNPTTETLNLSLLNFSGQVQFEIYNAIGNKLQSFSKTVDNGIRMNYVTYSAADLPNGTYTIVARMADGTSVTEQFVVLK